MKTRGVVAAATLATLLLCPVAARAQVFDSGGADYEPPEPQRRYGFAFGLGYGAGYGRSLGYPNKLGEIDNPDFEQSVSGVAFASSIWFGGTLRDWFTFGLGLSSRAAEEDGLLAQNGAFVVHLEGFPLWALGGEWRDVGIFAETGVGGATIVDEDRDIVADGGAMSVLGVGAFYEPWQLWHFSFGPGMAYHYEYSPSLSTHVVSLGMRAVFYGVQP